MSTVDRNRDRGMVIVGWILTVIRLRVGWLRIYTHVALTRLFGSDDVFYCHSKLNSNILCNWGYGSVIHGLSQHESTLNGSVSSLLVFWRSVDSSCTIAVPAVPALRAISPPFPTLSKCVSASHATRCLLVPKATTLWPTYFYVPQENTKRCGERI